MKVRFDQIRVDIYPEAEDLGLAADRIIASYHARQVVSAVGAGGSACNDIVAECGDFLSGLTKHPSLYDADVLPFDKETIKSALVDCAKQQIWSEEECNILGELHFNLSYFRCGLTERENEPGSVLLREQRAEGVALRSEWQRLVTGQKQSRFSQFFASWLKH